MPSLACLLIASLLTASAEEKIDAEVLNSAGADQKVAVLLLLQDQHLIGPSALDSFIKANKGADRMQLRTNVVQDLKRRGDSQQDRLIRDLSLPSGSYKLWIVNAIGCELSLAEVKPAAESRWVKYISAVRGLPASAAATGR